MDLGRCLVFEYLDPLRIPLLQEECLLLRAKSPGPCGHGSTGPLYGNPLLLAVECRSFEERRVSKWR